MHTVGGLIIQELKKGRTKRMCHKTHEGISRGNQFPKLNI